MDAALLDFRHHASCLVHITMTTHMRSTQLAGEDTLALSEVNCVKYKHDLYGSMWVEGADGGNVGESVTPVTSARV
jgi:hypothetical protein